jgi:hypothetical protein
VLPNFYERLARTLCIRTALRGRWTGKVDETISGEVIFDVKKLREYFDGRSW